jgi:hypothetical protein
MMTHPSFEPGVLDRAMPTRPAVQLREGLAERIASLARRKQITVSSAAVAARLLVSLAHDWALSRMHGVPSRGARDLTEMVDAVWQGLRTRHD